MIKGSIPLVLRWISLILVLVVVAVGCDNSKRIAKGKKPDGKSPQYLMKRLSKNQLDFDWMTAKVGSTVQMGDKEYNFKSTVRVRRDSCIWVSMSPALGIEAARVLITLDSVKFINKLEKTYWVGSFDDLNQWLAADVDYFMLQEFLVGNAVAFDFEGKYKSSIDTTFQYLLTAKGARKLRKAVDVNGKKEERRKVIESDTTMGITYNERKLEKALEKTAEDEQLLLRYWLNPLSFQVERVVINDLAHNGVLELQFSEYGELLEQQFPYQSSLFLTNGNENLRVDLKYTKVKLNKPTKFPFRIQSKYEQIQR